MDEMLAAPVRSPEVISLPEPVGDVIAHALAEIGARTVFGVISIHNMPILDAIARVLRNDRGYGVIRNIQDAQFGGRRHYADLHTPDFAQLAASFALPHRRVSRTEDFEAALDAALSERGRNSSKSI
jgi:thiamine pyrophosphate-dependent acetolactate synthase large subunit-like protein